MKRRSFFKGLLLTIAATATPNVLAERKLVKKATKRFPAMLPPGCRSFVTTVHGKSGELHEIHHDLSSLRVTALAYSRDERWMTTVAVEPVDVNTARVQVGFPGIRGVDDSLSCSVIIASII